MAVFKSVEHMNEVLGGLFQSILDDPTVGPKLKQAGVILKYNITDPEGDIWIDSKEGRIIVGEYDREPTIELKVSGDTIHNLLLRKTNINAALATKKIIAKGPIQRVLKLIGLFNKAFELYPDVAREDGLPV